jgi:cysteine desulfurase / selenocysteine lyase
MPHRNTKKLFFSYMGVSPLCEASRRAIVRFLHDYVKLGPPEVIEKYQGYVRRLSEEVALLLHCDPDEVIYLKNTGEGLIMASEALPLGKGDEVLVLGNEYPANLIPWLKLKKDGVGVQVIPGMDNHKGFRELLSRIGPKTKAVAIAWGEHYDGYLPNLALLSRRCRKYDAHLVVDGVQGVGARAIDLKKTSVAFLVCGGQKYLGSIVGSGFMYVNRRTMGRLKDSHVGVRSVERFDEHGYELRKTAARFQDGTENLLGIVSLHAAVKAVNRIGIKEIERKNLALLASLKTLLRENDIPFIDHPQQTNVVALTVDDPISLATRLRTQNIYTRPVKGVERISFTHTTRERDLRKLVKEIKACLSH